MIATQQAALEFQRIQTMGRLSLAFGGAPEELAAFLEERFAAYLEPKTTPGSGEIAGANTWFPTIFPPWRGPVLGVSELYSDGQSSIGAPGMPGLIVVGCRIHLPSITRPNQGASWTDGRQEARDRCRLVADAFRRALFADEWLKARVEGIGIGRSEASDSDRMGNPYEDLASKGNRYLWIHSLPVEVRL